jgi:chemotaxis protein methyltransferase CheR
MIDVDRAHFVTLLKERCGIELSAQKAYLIDARLQGVAERAGRPGVPALLAAIRGAPTSSLADEALDAMTTNETLFFRDGAPFTHLAELLRRAARENPGAPFRVWSAACATGQEPYSIAMTAIETVGAARVEILASDVSARCVEVARRGVYSDFEIQRGLTPERRDRHFERRADGWWARPRLRETIDWRRHNLLEPLRHPHRFDALFCRNVLIYFDAATRAAVFERLADRLAPGGVLYLGGAETPIGLSTAFRALSDGSGGFVRF